MKKIFAITLSAVMILSSLMVSNAAQANAAPTLLHPVVSQHYQSAQDSKNMFVYEITWNDVTLEGKEAKNYKKLQKKFAEVSANQKATALERKTDFLKDYEAEKKNGNFAPREEKNTFFFIRCDSNYTSTLVKTYTFNGGQRGGSCWWPENYNSKTGESLQLSDVVIDPDRFAKAVREKLLKNYPNTKFDMLDDYLNNTRKDFFWTLGYDGITVYLNEGDVAPLSEGTFEVLLPYNEYEEFFKNREVLAAAPDNYVSAKPATFDGKGHDVQPYLASTGGNTYTLEFIELEDDDAQVVVKNANGDIINNLNGRLTCQNTSETVEGPVDGCNCSQRVKKSKAFVDASKFTLEYYDRVSCKTVTKDYSLSNVVK